jgi:predicted acyl esterase
MIPGYLYTLLALCTAAAPIPASMPQCVDPPADGNFVEHLDQVVTYTDNYRTYMDVRIPSVPASACGWPMVVLIHTTGTSRAVVTEKARAMAERGFVSVTYDVRGQGLGMGLNDPRFSGREILGMRERLDMFEIMEAAEALYPDKIDFDRIGVTGKSQGGVHSWLAAAHSGKMLPPNPWRNTPAPVIKAVAPINFGPEFFNALMPEAQAFSEMNARQFYEDEAISGIHNNPSVYAIIEPFLAAEDYQGMAATLYDPALDLALLLPDSEVPVLASLAYDDKYATVNHMLGDWRTYLKPGTPKFLSLSTTGHGTPFNEGESIATEYRRIQFFEELLKGIDHQMISWPKYRFAVTPANPTEYLDPDFIWDVVQSDQWPLDGTTQRRFYFAPGILQDSPPNIPRQRTLEHRSYGANLSHYLDQLPSPEDIVAQAPLQSIDFVGTPLQEDLFLVGTPKVSLNVTVAEADFQLTVSLFEESSGRFLTGGFTTIRGNTTTSEQLVEIEMGTAFSYLPKGARIRVQVENLAWHRPPGPISYLHALPIFSDFDATLRLGGNSAAYIDLPTKKMDQPILTTGFSYLASYGSADGELALRTFQRDHASWNYQVLAGFSGISPGMVFQGVQVPINADLLTNLIINSPGSLPITDFSGTLNSLGRSTPSVQFTQLGQIPAMIQELDFCGVVISPAGTEAFVSDPVRIPIE